MTKQHKNKIKGKMMTIITQIFGDIYGIIKG